MASRGEARRKRTLSSGGPDELTSLLRRIAAADATAFAALYKLTSSDLYGVVARIANRGDVAADCLQETYVRIWRKAYEFDPLKGSPLAWMATIARNCALDEVRRVAPASLEDVDFEPAAQNVDPRRRREGFAQLFSSTPIVPARFQFRVTDLTRAMADLSDEFVRWRPSLAEAFATGEDYTRGIPIEGEDADYNKIGRKYPGPVVLISDALAFSTADIFAAGFIDNGLGKVICTDGNMAAAGGNNWTWDAVRIYNPDFHLDAKLKTDIVAGRLVAGIVDAFNANGMSLSAKATLSAGVVTNGDTLWTILDGSLAHTIRDQSWMSPNLEVYFGRTPSGLADLPSGIVLSLTMRRAIRVKAHEGQVLEDVGIVPDILYRMTLRDVMEQNQDLFERVGKELAVPAMALASAAASRSAVPQPGDSRTGSG